MKKIVLLVVLAALASWYFHFGRKMTESSVNAYYDKQTELMSKLEAEPLCTLMARDYKTSDVSFSPSGTERTEMNKEQACEDLKEGLAVFKQLSDASRGMLTPTFGQQIKSVSLSEGDKLATVEGTVTVKMGEILIARTRFTEKLIRRNGKILSLGGESKSWMYGGG